MKKLCKFLYVHGLPPREKPDFDSTLARLENHRFAGQASHAWRLLYEFSIGGDKNSAYLGHALGGIAALRQCTAR